MKKFTIRFIAVACLILAMVSICLVGCNSTISVTGIALDKTTLTLTVGETATLSATVKPDDATDNSVTWTSSEPTIATVDQNGKVTAKAKGSATITAKAGEKTATCAVTVNEATSTETVDVTGVTLTPKTLTLEEGKTSTLTATVAPSNASDKTVSWTSSEPTIATVDQNGKVTAVKAGQTNITVTTNNGNKTDTCAVTVTTKTVDVQSITLDNTALTLEVDEIGTLTATVTPNDATNKTVTWESDTTEVATVDNSGKVTAIKEGSATITASVGEKSASCTVTVIAKKNHITSEDDLKTAFGKTDEKQAILVLDQNIEDISEQLVVAKGAKIMLDLNGHKIAGSPEIKAEEDIEPKAPTTSYYNALIRVLGELTVSGTEENGEISSAHCYAIVVGSDEDSGMLTIESGNIIGETTAVQVTKGKATILGGDFKVTNTDDGDDQYGQRYMLNCINKNYIAEEASIEVKGGTFHGFNPQDPKAGDDGDFVATGYISVKESETEDTQQEIYTVRALEEVSVDSFENLKSAVEKDCKITLTTDIEVTEQLEIAQGKRVVIDLNGHKLHETKAEQPQEQVQQETQKQFLTVIRVFGNLTVLGDEDSEISSDNGHFAIIVGKADQAGILIIEGGKFKGETDAIYVHTGTAYIKGGDFSITDVDAKGHKFVLNCLDENYNNGKAKIIVTGGTFHGFDPSKSEGDKKDENNADFVKEGYESKPDKAEEINENTVYTVQKKAPQISEEE